MSTALRSCLGCTALGPWGRNGRCDDCRLKRNRQIDRTPRRRALKSMLYNAEHQRLRAHWAPIVALGGVRCARCHEPIEPGSPFHLDHINGTRHPSHPRCNVAARANPRKAAHV